QICNNILRGDSAGPHGRIPLSPSPWGFRRSPLASSSRVIKTGTRGYGDFCHP
ncbi:hypothetical protein PIB30_099565, partial [Stylosanthes scabra]|nr:hypothetical protein [Stylosanthes scabra]